MEPLAILSTFELVLSCILILLHLIEQSHIAGHYASFALPLLATLSHSRHFFDSKISLSLALALSSFFAMPYISEVFILQTPCLYPLLARWPELSRKSLATEILWRFGRGIFVCAP